MAERRAAFLAKSAELALVLGQVPTVEPGVIRIPSRTRLGSSHDIRIALDGEPICNCEASFNHTECWAVKLVKEEGINMSTQTAVAIRPVQLAERQALLPTSHEMAMIREAANMAMAGAISLPPELNTPQKVAAVMLYGLELGLKPMSAIRHLYIVNGKVQPSTEVMAGLVMKAEPDCRILVEELTDEVCTMRLQRPSRHLSEPYTVTWAEITKAGLAGGQNAKYPRDRLRYHCTKRLLRIYAPDLINSMDGPSLESVVPSAFSNADLFNEGDEVVEGEYTVNRETGEIVESAPAEPADPTISHDQYVELSNIYSAIISKETRKEVHQAVLQACGYADKGDGTVSWMKLLQADFDGVRRLLNQVVDAQNAPAEPSLPFAN
jgi:hypothetical protein